MEFSSSSDEDEALEWQLRRSRTQRTNEEASVRRVHEGSSGGSNANGGTSRNSCRSVMLPSSTATIEMRRGTIYIPVRNKYVHVTEAKARPQNFFGNPSIRVALRPVLAGYRVVLKELTPANGWREVRLPGAAVTGVFVFDHVEEETRRGGRGDAGKQHSELSPGPVNVLAGPRTSSSLCEPPVARQLRFWTDPQLQRRIDPASWWAHRESPDGFACTTDTVWPTGEAGRLCSMATVDAWGTVWGLRDRDRCLSLISRRPADTRLGESESLRVDHVATLPLEGPTAGKTLGLVRLPGFRDDAGALGAAVVVASHQLSLVSLPNCAERGSLRQSPLVASSTVRFSVGAPYDSWCVDRAMGEFGVSPSSLSQPLSSADLVVGSENGVVEVRFESEGSLGGRWRARRSRVFPMTMRVTALGVVGNCIPTNEEPRFLLAGMRNGTIQLCHTDWGSKVKGCQTVDNTPRHKGASVVSLHQLSTHKCQFASVSSEGEVRVWDLRYFAGAGEPVAVVRDPIHMNFDGRVKVSWCGDVVAVVSEPAGFCACVNAARPGASFMLQGGDMKQLTCEPAVVLARAGLAYDLYLFGDRFTRCISFDAS